MSECGSDFDRGSKPQTHIRPLFIHFRTSTHRDPGTRFFDPSSLLDQFSRGRRKKHNDDLLELQDPESLRPTTNQTCSSFTAALQLPKTTFRLVVILFLRSREAEHGSFLCRFWRKRAEKGHVTFDHRFLKLAP